MRPKISIIGAGSSIFAKNIIGDILFLKEFGDSEIVLYDINAERLKESKVIVSKLCKTLNVNPKLTISMDLEQSLSNAHFVITMFQIGGYEPATVIDFEVPKKYGLQQTIADTLGVGGIMRAVRSIPVFLEIVAIMREVCPNAYLLNYVNPMAMISWAISEFAPDIKYVGLCHSVQGTIYEIANDIDAKYEDIRYLSAGINHMSFYLTLEKKDKNGEYQSLYPLLNKSFLEEKTIPKPPSQEQNPRCMNYIRYYMMTKLGYFVTESSEHFAEYTPYFIKNNRPDLIEKFKIPLDEYPKRCIEQIANWKKTYAEYQKTDTVDIKNSNEYASQILHSIWTNEPSVINASVKNDGLIDNILQGASVEVPCLIDGTGIHPIKIGKIPVHLSALISTSVNVQSLVVEAFKTQDKKYLYYAAMLDPHTAAELDIESIYKMVDELLVKHKEQGYMPTFI